jgi:hydroxymethylglutaryl-CoA lyase
LNVELKIIETPRDGFQGLKEFVPTALKTNYINHLLKAGFDTVEVGSFVSPKAVPQMADTRDVLKRLDLSGPYSKIMVLAGNEQGGLEAAEFPQVDYILYPFSFSPAFLKRNLNSDIVRAKEVISNLRSICGSSNKELIVYLTMAFGNPYGDPWSVQMVSDWAGYLISEGIKIIPLSDIMGDVTPERITAVYSQLMKEYPGTEFGIHLHCRPDDYFGKVNAAWQAGVRRFDTVLGGFGGCPFAGDHLVSNLNTKALMTYLEKIGLDSGLDEDMLGLAENSLPLLTT